MKLIGFILTDNYIAGLLISNACLIVSCIYLYKLAKLDADDASALRSIKYLLLFPVSFILSGVFTESLYLMLVLMCFYYARTDRWHLAGGLGFFLALTRSLGVLIVLPLLYEGLQPLFSKGVSLKNLKSLTNLISFRNDLIPILSRLSYLLLIPLGLAVFMAYNYYLTGDFLAFAHAQAAWGRHFGSPLLTLLDAFDSNINSKFEAVFAAVSLSVFLLFYNRIRVSYWIFGIYSMLVPLFTGIMSMPRFILVIFPIYILLADLTEKRVSEEIAILSLALLQGCLMVFWSNGFNLII
ncbi:hypothetical protein FTO70_14725 [Methanosarcina sp. KYL-1]|uniref:hypothetical protein n=1 Tax=Methanosarcina sp. KYL-1 TaxID=2602068 RepID=UPI0021016E70|nr:hypothetical protein [Methanosarcina sp. KYL-1]MCQ1536903.1 hypothetical protein [Methanosarcina sp. KYL-1]